jgi:hypothetical protein
MLAEQLWQWMKRCCGYRSPLPPSAIWDRGQRGQVANGYEFGFRWNRAFVCGRRIQHNYAAQVATGKLLYEPCLPNQAAAVRRPGTGVSNVKQSHYGLISISTTVMRLGLRLDLEFLKSTWNPIRSRSCTTRTAPR